MPEHTTKAQAGRPLLISARDWNAMRAMVAGRWGGKTGPPAGDPRAPLQNVVVAYNAAGAAAPWRGVIEFAQAQATPKIASFVKPGDAGGAATYGILLQPVAAGAYGQVAITGGAYTVLVDGDAVVGGDQVGPVDGQWYASAGSNPATWAAITSEADGTARAVFLGGGGGTASMIVASGEFTADDVPGSAKYLEADGTQGTTVTVRRPNGVKIMRGDTGFLGKDSSGQNVFIPCHARQDENLGFRIETRTSDPSSAQIGDMWLRTDNPE